MAGSRPVAVVTGASGGVGRATVRELARCGYDVGLIARGRAGLEAAAEEVTLAGGRSLAVPTDVASWDEVDATASRIEEELGPIEVWVNDAMTTVFGTVADIEASDLQRATEVTFLGQVHGAKAALARMRSRDRGTIISVGSALAFRGIPLQSAYCASKFAVRGFMESLRCELLEAGSGVEVCQVHLPAVNTTQFGWCRALVDRHPMPVPPIYQPEVPARAIAAVARRPRREKVVGTWNWVMLRLSQAMPGVGDHFMARTGRSGQLTDIPISPGRADDLYSPVDQETDQDAHGIFDDQARGMATPSFLASLPGMAADFAVSFAQRSRGRVASLRR